jgi:hypothetical protein
MEMRDIKVDKTEGGVAVSSSSSGSGSVTATTTSFESKAGSFPSSTSSSSLVPSSSPSSLTPSASFSAASPLTLSSLSSPSTGPVLDPNAPVAKAKPEDFIHFFVGRPLHLQRFLEHVLTEPKCSTIIYNTLLELYLRQEADEKNEKGDGKVDIVCFLLFLSHLIHVAYLVMAMVCSI